VMDPADNKSKNETVTKQNEYLWERSGEPDAELQKLEVLLGQFRHNRPTPALPQVEQEGRWAFLSRFRPFPTLVAAAAGLVIIGIGLMIYGRKTTPVAAGGWEVSQVAGTPRIGHTAVRSDQAPRHLGVGEMLETDDHSQASLDAADVGMIEIDQNTRLRLLAMGKTRKQIALDRGTIHTHIWAPAGEFVVNTPSAVTVDLGCAYTLTVDDSGAGLVRTSLGWVGFKLNGHESFIPAGAACSTRPTIGPGTPYFEDASSELRAALAKFDFEDKTPQQRGADLSIVLSQSRKRDSLTLWHLLARVDQDKRVEVYDRLEKLAPAPAGVTRDGILHLDQSMLDQWWNALGYDDISIWRRWERSWSEQTSRANSDAPPTASAKSSAK
jgi:hypothetical protein